MKLLTLATMGKNDGFGGAHAMEKISYCMKKNHALMTAGGFDVDYLFVDWGSERAKSMCNEPLLSKLPFLRFIYVTREVLSKEGYNPERMLEFYAKNVVIRNVDTEYILLLNDDIYFTPSIVQKLKGLITSEQQNFYARPWYKVSHDYNLEENFEGDKMVIREEYPIAKPELGPSEGSVGDFLFAHTETLKSAGGFNEVENKKFDGKHSHMDRGFCRKLLVYGVQPIIWWDEKIFHLHHHHGYTVEPPSVTWPLPVDGSCNGNFYNPPNWGLADYKHEKVSDKLMVIH
jgi:hypothetical protein